MIFKGAILGGAQKFHVDSYLNGTTVPFDTHLWVWGVYATSSTFEVSCNHGVCVWCVYVHARDWICEKVPFHAQNLTCFLNFETS